jgi:hypothetical protein
MNGVSIRPPHVEQHRARRTTSENRGLIVTVYLVHVHNVLKERRRVVEVADA